MDGAWVMTLHLLRPQIWQEQKEWQVKHNTQGVVVVECLTDKAIDQFLVARRHRFEKEHALCLKSLFSFNIVAWNQMSALLKEYPDEKINAVKPPGDTIGADDVPFVFVFAEKQGFLVDMCHKKHVGFREMLESCMNCGIVLQQQPKKGHCAKCKLVVYCDKACQRQHWPMHKQTCCDKL